MLARRALLRVVPSVIVPGGLVRFRFTQTLDQRTVLWL